MPRKPAFTTASLYIHFQPSLVKTFPVLDGVPAAMRDLVEELAAPAQRSISIGTRLKALKRLIDEEALQVSLQHA